MSVATCLFEPSPAELQPTAISKVRVNGGVTLSVHKRGEQSVVDALRQCDGYKVRFPNHTAHPQAVIINTGGGLASGDNVVQSFDVAAGGGLTVTTQGCERVYRRLDDAAATTQINAQIGDGAVFNWIPQETILFDNAGLNRHFDIACTSSSRLFLTETLILGRKAMGEVMTTGDFRDVWRIRRDGKLAFAENVHIGEDALARMDQAAITNGAHVISTSLLMAADAEDRLERVRATIADGHFEVAASAWNGMLVVRALAHSSAHIRDIMKRVVPVMADEKLPRVWNT